MKFACIACRLEMLKEGDYQHRIFPEEVAGRYLYCYLLCHLVQLLCDIVVITGRLFEEAVISVLFYAGKMVSDGVDYPETKYLQPCLWYHFVPLRRATNRHIVSWQWIGGWFF